MYKDGKRMIFIIKDVSVLFLFTPVILLYTKSVYEIVCSLILFVICSIHISHSILMYIKSYITTGNRRKGMKDNILTLFDFEF